MPYRTDGVTPLGAQISSKQLELIREKELYFSIASYKVGHRYLLPPYRWGAEGTYSTPFGGRCQLRYAEGLPHRYGMAERY